MGKVTPWGRVISDLSRLSAPMIGFKGEPGVALACRVVIRGHSSLKLVPVRAGALWVLMAEGFLGTRACPGSSLSLPSASHTTFSGTCCVLTSKFLTSFLN